MTNVSKQKLKKEFQDQLFNQFSELLSSGNKKQTHNFLLALLTDSEKIMFVKRVAAVLMLSKKHSPYRIAETLKISETTANKMRLAYEVGEYSSIVELSKKKEFDSKKFWATIDVCLRLGMPSMGKDRWDSIRTN